MKDMIKSFRLFTASSTIKASIATMAAIIAIFFVIAILPITLAEKSDFWRGFASSFLPMSCTFASVMGIGIMNTVFSYNIPTTPGYKYFHSLSDGGKKFRQALIASNVIACIIVLAGAIISAVLGIVADISQLFVFTAIVGFVGLGMANFTGFSGNVWVRMLGIMPICFLAGGVTGFLCGDSENGGELPQISLPVAAVIIAVCLAVYVSGLIYMLCNAEKKWGSIK